MNGYGRKTRRKIFSYCLFDRRKKDTTKDKPNSVYSPRTVKQIYREELTRILPSDIVQGGNFMMKRGFRFSIDRGGTFTDIYAECPNGKARVLKLLSEDPQNYPDAPREGIRRILQEVNYLDLSIVML